MAADQPKKSILDLTAMAGEMLKPKELIELKNTGALTLQDRRVFNKLIENAWGKNLGRAGHWFEIATAELRDATDRNKRLGDSIERLMQTICLVVDEENEVETRTALLSSNRLETNANNGTFHYKLTEELAELLKDSTIFAKLDLEVMRSFRSKYAFSLYEAIARRIRLRRFTENLTMQEIRDVLGVEEGKLSDYRNLNLRAIQPALEEVNAITPYQVSILPQKKGRKVESFIMGWSVKDTDGMQKAYKVLQQPKVGRRARVDGDTDNVIDQNNP
jgi:plasmid replication initiation protein